MTAPLSDDEIAGMHERDRRIQEWYGDIAIVSAESDRRKLLAEVDRCHEGLGLAVEWLTVGGSHLHALSERNAREAFRAWLESQNER